MQQEILSISNSKFLMRIGLYIIIMVMIFVHYSKEYSKATEGNAISEQLDRRYEDFYALEDNSLDMIFIGSSHSYCTFDPNIFDDFLSTNSFQLGTPLQHPDATYYLLNKIFETQSPELVVMELYWDVLDTSFDDRQLSFFFNALNDSEMRENYIKNVFPVSEQLKYSLLPIRYQQEYFAYKSSFWENTISSRFGLFKKSSPAREGLQEYKSKGYVYCEYVIEEAEFDETNQFKGLDGKYWKFDETQKYYLDLIVEFLEEKDVELIFVTAPIAPVSLDFIKNYEEINDRIRSVTNSYDIEYIDYNIKLLEENIQLEHEHFQDDAHLNSKGAEIVCNDFIDIIKHHFQ